MTGYPADFYAAGARSIAVAGIDHHPGAQSDDTGIDEMFSKSGLASTINVMPAAWTAWADRPVIMALRRRHAV
jgi:hypothetical protein